MLNGDYREQVADLLHRSGILTTQQMNEVKRQIMLERQEELREWDRYLMQRKAEYEALPWWRKIVERKP